MNRKVVLEASINDAVAFTCTLRKQNNLISHDKCLNLVCCQCVSQCSVENGDEEVKTIVLICPAVRLFYGGDNVALTAGLDDMMIYCDVIEVCAQREILPYRSC